MPTVCEIGPQEVFGILRDQSPEQRLQTKSLLPKVVYFLHLEDLIQCIPYFFLPGLSFSDESYKSLS